MYAEEILLFLIINFFYLFLGYGCLSLFLKHQRRQCILFLFVFTVLWLLLNLLYYHVLTGTPAMRIVSAAAVAAILLCSTVLFNLYDKLKEKTDSRIREALYERQLEYYSRQYQEISRSQAETRKMRHELKNNYILLEALARKGDTESILACLPQMYETAPQALAAHTGNIVVDAVINYRISSAQTDNIRFQLKLGIPTRLDISDIRLCGLLGNALDNAVEACLRVPEENRCITISMQIEKKNLFIEITNPYDGTLYSDNRGRLRTRKENAAHHGYGLSIMEELLDNIGSMETVWDESTFSLRIILYSVI